MDGLFHLSCCYGEDIPLLIYFSPFHLKIEEINCNPHVTEVLGQFSLVFGCDVFGIRRQMTQYVI